MRRSDIATLDNGTMVEAFKFFDYCQLAKNSLVAMRFRDVIQTHRHKLALLSVYSIRLSRSSQDFGFSCKIFDKKLSTEAYNEWVVRNNYSKEAPLEDQVATTQSKQIFQPPYVYELWADTNYKELCNRGLGPEFTVFYARVKKINDETWPVFEHFVHLLTDPFIYICAFDLFPHTDVFSLLAATIDRSNRGRLQCEKMAFGLNDYTQKSFNWIKDHICCVEFQCAGCRISPNYDKQLLDFFATGFRCASEIVVYDLSVSDVSKAVIIDLVQKFMDLKSCDESHIVHSIQAHITRLTTKALKSKYAKFFIREEKNRYGWISTVFEIVNIDVGKKMQLSINNETHILTLVIINL